MDRCLISATLLAIVFVIAVSAGVTEKMLKVPLVEVGGLWFKSFTRTVENIISLCTTWPDFYSITTYVVLSILSVVLYYTYQLFFVPINRIRILGDTGYIPEGKFTKKEIANSVRKRRMVGEVPPVYPNGWYGVTASRDLKVGQSINISMLGLNLALFRGESGESYILDAYCPHMGANVGAGGRIKGDCIECPFHGWQFRGYDGKCTKIPYADKVPDFAKIKSYISREVNGWIYLWFHAEGVEPTWQLPEMEEITNGEWTYKGRTEHHINAHIEEIPENGADVSHLDQVHGPLLSAGIDLRHMWSKIWSFGNHAWTAQWEQNKAPEEHIGTLRLTHSLKLFGKHLSIIDMDVTARQIGPSTVYLTYDSFFGKGVYIQHVIPIEPMVQKVIHNVYMDRRLPIIIGKFFMLGEALMVERDIMIWNNKKYEGKPMFVKSKEDTLIAKHRRWYSQFYSENSPRLTFKKSSLEW